ncbi:hypothetical protein [uncultured Bilophila sp.]|uniref:hypothetical protein n=1 Tax=uncultured Bilophila sp. TaxID=529385 RepID=UPI00280BA80A|nr:hypothetical protein [uncultured Bilophila sp.]
MENGEKAYVFQHIAETKQPCIMTGPFRRQAAALSYDAAFQKVLFEYVVVSSLQCGEKYGLFSSFPLGVSHG